MRMNGIGARPEPAVLASGAMRPLRGALPVFASPRTALGRLDRDEVSFLVVVAPRTGALLGAVDRDSLAPRECCAGGLSRCSVVRHLSPDAAFCFGEEEVEEVLVAEAELAAEGKVSAERSIPLLVVDQRLKPLGFLPNPAASLGATCDGLARVA